MVAMNLGVVALAMIELRNFVLDPLRALLRFVGVFHKDLTSALICEPAGGADVVSCEVQPAAFPYA
jgi:hypothetical protein